MLIFPNMTICWYYYIF